MSNEKILFADDDPEIREVVRLLLASEGFQVDEAVSGEDELSILADRFTELSLKKSFQIKDMSDKLFEYFFVYSADHDDQQIETLPADLFMQEALDDFTWSLENRGFFVEKSECHLTGMLKINPDLLKRVFDNLYSNLLKYADPCAPVIIYCEENEQGFLLQVKNNILKSAAIKEGSRIGLATCERIAAFHNGSFSYKKTEDDFQAELRLPVF